MTETTETNERSRQSISALLIDGWKIMLTFVLGAASYFGSPFSQVLHQHWHTVALGSALLMSIYVLFQREVKGASLGANLGIKRATARREEIDSVRMLDAVKHAKSIDMLGFNLRRQWFRPESKFDEIITCRLKNEKNLKIRILIADPECHSIARKGEFEDGTSTERMKADGFAVQSYLVNLRKSAETDAVEVKLLDADMIRCSLIIAGDHMFATWYLSFSGGSNSPAFEIMGEKTAFYKSFKLEYEKLWLRGRLLEDG
jgi:hypothetical protein